MGGSHLPLPPPWFEALKNQGGRSSWAPPVLPSTGSLPFPLRRAGSPRRQPAPGHVCPPPQGRATCPRHEVATSQLGGARPPPRQTGLWHMAMAGLGGGRGIPARSDRGSLERDPAAGAALCSFQSLPSGFWLFPGAWLRSRWRLCRAVAAVPCPALAVAGRCFPNASASLGAPSVVSAAEGSVGGWGWMSPPDPRAPGGSETGTGKIFPRTASPGPVPSASHGHHRGGGTTRGRRRCPWLGGPGGLPPARQEAAPYSGTGCPGSTARPGAARGGGPQKGTEWRGEGAPRAPAPAGAVAAGGVNSPLARPSLCRAAGAGARGPWP